MTQVTVPVRPTDAPFFNSFAARTRDGDHNPRKWGIPWGRDYQCMEHLRSVFHLTDPDGNLVQRVILEPEKRSPDGTGKMGVSSGASWEIMDPFRKQVLIDVVHDRWSEDDNAGRPRCTVGFYENAVNDGSPYSLRNTGTGCLSLDTDAGLERFKVKWGPWLDTGILSEVCYDAGIYDHLWGPVQNLLEDQMARFGLYGMTEAIRWDSRTNPPRRVYEWAEYRVPMWCISRYILSRDPDNLLSWEPDEHVWIMNSPKTSGLLTAAQAADFRKRGWGVGFWMEGDEWKERGDE